MTKTEIEKEIYKECERTPNVQGIEFLVIIIDQEAEFYGKEFYLIFSNQTEKRTLKNFFLYMKQELILQSSGEFAKEMENEFNKAINNSGLDENFYTKLAMKLRYLRFCKIINESNLVNKISDQESELLVKIIKRKFLDIVDEEITQVKKSSSKKKRNKNKKNNLKQLQENVEVALTPSICTEEVHTHISEEIIQLNAEHFSK
jgi:hypothetical protein